MSCKLKKIYDFWLKKRENKHTMLEGRNCNMSILYQLVNMGSPKWQKCPDSLKEKGINFVREDELDCNYPHLYLYWGSSYSDAQYDGKIELTKLANLGLVLPIVDNPENFRNFIPEALGEVNALIYDSNGSLKLENYILAHFGLIEQNRKIFISYKRSDTTGVAIQLFDELTKLGYRPFLDAYSIGSGVNFQEYLKHELADSDVFVFLNSKDYYNSPYILDMCSQALNIP